MKTDQKYKLESKEFFDKVSDKEYGNTEKLHSYLIENISFKDKETILDLGCGRGEFLEMIRRKNKDATLIGLDIAPKMIDICRKRNIEDCTFSIGDSENLPYESGSFDKIFCLNSFHHYPNPVKVIEEIGRVLKKDGIIVIGEVKVFPILKEVINLFLPLLRSGDYRMYSKKSLNKLFEDKEFKNESFLALKGFLFVGVYSKVKLD